MEANLSLYCFWQAAATALTTMPSFIKGLFKQLSIRCGVSHFSSLLPNAFTLLLHKIHVLLNVRTFLVAHMNRLNRLSPVLSELIPGMSVSR